MIKQIKKFQIKLTPLDAMKKWMMSTTNNQDLLLMDDTSSSFDEPVALEFIDYGGINNDPILNYECDIALEQQPDDLVDTRIGLNVSGLFYPNIDPINKDKTYKRVVFSQIRTMFYNNHRDPTKTWGMENIDFELSKTKRKLSDELRLFDVPRSVYGDKITPGSVTIQYNSLDVDHIITDDGDGNLIAGNNLFSKQQEIGDHRNLFNMGVSTVCNSYFTFDPPGVPTLQGNVTGSILSVGTSSLTWNDTSLTINGFILEKSLDDVSFTTLTMLNGNINAYLDYPISSSTQYYYRIKAFNNYGTSSNSNVVNIFF